MHGEGENSVDTMVVRAAFAAGVGLAEDPTNKQWWLVRVGEISFEEVNWDGATTKQVTSAMAAQCENEHLRRLADSLAHIDLRETPR